MKRQDFRFSHRLRVRWSEVDPQRIVFNGHYLTYADVAMNEFWRTLGLPYEEAMRQLGGDLFVKKATVEFHASARMDDQLDIAVQCSRIGHSSMTFTGAMFRGEQHVASVELIYVFAHPANQVSQAIPPSLRQCLQQFEAGEPVLSVRCGAWPELGEAARRVRTAVFIHEQGIAREDEWDDADHDAVHVVAFNRLEQAVATGRLLRSAEPGVAKIGRMAVHRALRGSGVGRQVLQALMQAAQQRGDHTVRLSAQRSAEGFYRRLGYRPVGVPYDDVGIAHIDMEIRL